MEPRQGHGYSRENAAQPVSDRAGTGVFIHDSDQRVGHGGYSWNLQAN